MVNPPQKPTIKRAFKRGGTPPDFPNNPKRIPKIKHPRILMVNVASGKGAFQKLMKSRFIRKRQPVPKNPPKPAININFHISANTLKVYLTKLQKKADLEVGLCFFGSQLHFTRPLSIIKVFI